PYVTHTPAPPDPHTPSLHDALPIWGGDETLIVISSHLSHYLPYVEARQVDQATVQSILQLEQSITHDQACGGMPINGLILAAQRDRKSTRLNSSHVKISYAVLCLKK